MTPAVGDVVISTAQTPARAKAHEVVAIHWGDVWVGVACGRSIRVEHVAVQTTGITCAMCQRIVASRRGRG